MQVNEVIKLLKNRDYDYRLGAVSILDWKARNKKITEKEKGDIYDAYVDNHNWIDDWGLVDRATPYVVGGYLFDKDRSHSIHLQNQNYLWSEGLLLLVLIILSGKTKLRTPLK